MFSQKSNQSCDNVGISLSQSSPERPNLALIWRPFCPGGQNNVQRLQSALNLLGRRAAIPPEHNIDELVEDRITPLLDMIRVGALLEKTPNDLRALPVRRRTEKFLNFRLRNRAL